MASIKYFSSNSLRNDKNIFKFSVMVWKVATEALRKGVELHDCTQDGLHQFIKSIKVLANSYELTRDPQKSGEKRSLIDAYGGFSLCMIKKHELMYVGGEGRKVQDNRILLDYVYHSLCTDGMS